MDVIESQFNCLVSELIGNKNKICVAVSGGCDSTALLLLTRQYAERYGIQVIALTVDHQLRQNSSFEAGSVNVLCNSLCVHHKILKWQHGNIPTGKVECEARNARYDLLTNECLKMGVDCLFVGHNADEQLETYMIRMAMHSENYGLACISGARTCKNGVTIIRPCLAFFKEQLKTYLTKNNIDWFEDEMNDDDRFIRVQFRKKLKTVSIGDKVAFLKKIYAYGVQRRETEVRSVDFLKSHHVISEHGFARLNRDDFCALDLDSQRDVLKRIIRCIGRNSYNVSNAVCDRFIFCSKGYSSGNVVLKKSGDAIFIYREIRNACVGVTLNAGEEIVFDGRFKIKSFIDELYVTMSSSDRRLLGLPAYIARTLPVFMVNGSVVHVGYNLDRTRGFVCKFLLEDDFFDVFYPLRVML